VTNGYAAPARIAARMASAKKNGTHRFGEEGVP
jgi:hypothetical protein